MKKLCLALAAAGILVGAGCSKKEEPKRVETPVVQPAPETNTQTTVDNTVRPADTVMIRERVYEGVLPCADCSGIRTRVTINHREGTDADNTYEMVQTYMGKEPNNVVVTSGKYEVKRGIDGDNMATIYILNSDRVKDDQQYYAVYSTDPTTMYALDRDMNRIASDLNYSLKLAN